MKRWGGYFDQNISFELFTSCLYPCSHPCPCLHIFSCLCTYVQYEYMYRNMDMYYTCACNDTRRCSRTGRFMYKHVRLLHVTWPAHFQDCVWPTPANPNRCRTAQDPRYSTVNHKLLPDCPWLTVYRPVHDQPLERCSWPIVTGLFLPNCYKTVPDKLLQNCAWPTFTWLGMS